MSEPFIVVVSVDDSSTVKAYPCFVSICIDPLDEGVKHSHIHCDLCDAAVLSHCKGCVKFGDFEWGFWNLCSTACCESCGDVPRIEKVDARAGKHEDPCDDALCSACDSVVHSGALADDVCAVMTAVDADSVV